jgi:ERCC4-type nuclease
MTTSPSEQMPRPNRATTILIDSREPAWVKALDFGKGATVQVAPLPAGDVLAMCDDGAAVAVERKTAGDLLGSLRDGRLLAQAGDLRQLTPWSYVVVTEPLYCGRAGFAVYEPKRGRTLVETAWAWRAVQGALLALQELGVGVVMGKGEEDFEATARWLFERARGPIAVSRRDTVPMDDATRILTSIPGVGAERAKQLLRDCGTVADALWALTDTPARPRPGGKNVVGVGPVTRRQARTALGLPEGWVLRAAREIDTDEETEADERVRAAQAVGGSPA